MVQAPVKRLTLEAFLSIPETKPASEYINGQVVQKPMPKLKHSRLQTKLSAAINEALEAGEIASAFSELRCTFHGRSIVPDITVLVWSRLPRDSDGDLTDDFKEYPDWAIEILSPGQSHTKVLEKILYALEHGAQMGWLINPEERSVLVCSAGNQIQLFMQEEQRLSVPTFASAFQMTLGDMFAWLNYGR